MQMATDNKLTMVVFSGDMDKVMAAFIIATGAAASGMDVTMFFTFWGFKAIEKEGALTGKGLFGRMLGLMNRGGVDTIGPSRFNFGGIGRWMMKKMMKDKNAASLRELRDLAIELGVKMMPLSEISVEAPRFQCKGLGEMVAVKKLTDLPKQKPPLDDILSRARELAQDCKDERGALRVYEQALKLYPDKPRVLSGLARLLAAADEKKLRDPKRAVQLAREAARCSAVVVAKVKPLICSSAGGAVI
jgi:peroxiredoxin family protein